VARTKLRVGGTDDPQEADADRVATQVTEIAAPAALTDTTSSFGSPAGAPPPAAPPGAPPTDVGFSSPGMPLPAGLARDFGARLGRDLSDVRIHTDPATATTADRLGALAFAVGPHVGFARGQFAPNGPAGRRLLAHELAHVVQDGPQRDILRRQPDPGTQADFDPTPSLAPPEPVVYGPEYVQDVVVSWPKLPGQRDAEQTFQVHVVASEKDRRDIKLWVVPISKLRLPPGSPKPPPAPTTPPPATAPPATGPPVAGSGPAPATPAVIPSHPALPPGSTVETVDGTRLTVEASTPTHVITAKYTKFAVGAASTSALKVSDGSVIVIDAGVNVAGMRDSAGKKFTEAKLAEVILKRLLDFIGSDGYVRELLLSHAHSDHVNLVPALLRKVAVGIIRFNDVMRRWAGTLRQQMQEAQTARLAEAATAFEQKMASQRTAWENGEGAGFAPDAREVAWRDHVRREFAKTRQGQAAIERVLVQVKGGTLDVVDFDLTTGERQGKTTPFTAEDPYTIAETARTPGVPRVTVDDKTGRPIDKIEDQDIDKYASSFIVQVEGGMTILVIPDLRAKDLPKLKERFRAAMGHVKRPYQIWDATHHLQKGWYNIEGRVAASQLDILADFLMEFRSAEGADAVVVSAQIDLTRAKARTLVDPVVLRFLRSLGFEAYVAASARDVEAVDITTATGQKMTGIIGTRAPGQGDPNLSVRRAKLALEKLAAQIKANDVAVKEETDAATKTTLTEHGATLRAQVTELNVLLENTLTEMDARLRPAKKAKTRTADLSKPPGDFPKQRLMDEWLARHDFDLPVVKDMHLTEMALVVLNRSPDLSNAPPGSPGARARELAGVRSRINELALRQRDGGLSVETRAELLVEYERYRVLLENELNPADPAQKPIAGTTRDLLTADLEVVKQRISGLTEAPPTTEYARVPGTGELVAQHVSVVRPLETNPAAPKVESPTMRGARQVAEGVGRIGGVVMVATTITGESDLLARWGKGKAAGGEVAIGTLKNVSSGAVGVLMLRGINVHPGVFVVLAVLEVGEAYLRPTDTQEQHDIAVFQAVGSSAVNLGCMGVGMALMAIPTPVTFVGGLIISTLGPVLLKALGVDEWIANWAERRGAFNPSAVVEVLQKLRKLLLAYQLVIGSMQLAKRALDPSDPTFAALPDAKERAEKVRVEQRNKALDLEDDILSEFRDAYKDARTSYAGLKDLDEYRAQFYALRQQAGLVMVSDIYRAYFQHRQTADETFREIDSGMSIDNYTAAQIEDMPQWKHLKDELGELSKLITDATDEKGHANVRDKDRRVQAMIDNARYRLAPSAQSVQRKTGLLTPTSAAGRAYEGHLVFYEAWLARLRRQYLEESPSQVGEQYAPGTTRSLIKPWATTPDWAMTEMDETIAMYSRAVETGEGPPANLVLEMSQTSQGVVNYKAYVESHDSYRLLLTWLQNVEQMIDGQLSQADRIVTAEPDATRQAMATRVVRARNAVKAARSLRFAKRRMVYPSELDELTTTLRAAEITKVAPLFGKDAVRPLTEIETLTLANQKGMFDSDVKVYPPLSLRLTFVRSPAAVDPDGNLANIFRLTGDVPLNLQYATKPTKPATPWMNAIVGVVLRAQFGAANNQYSDILEVYPLNDAAVRFFKEDKGWLVYRWNVAPIKASELPPVTPAVGAGAPGAAPAGNTP
jgi:hypothetical protein